MSFPPNPCPVQPRLPHEYFACRFFWVGRVVETGDMLRFKELTLSSQHLERRRSQQSVWEAQGRAF